MTFDARALLHHRRVWIDFAFINFGSKFKLIFVFKNKSDVPGLAFMSLDGGVELE